MNKPQIHPSTDEESSIIPTFPPKQLQAAITLTAWQAMLAACRSEWPREACGILTTSRQAGRADNGTMDGIIRMDQIYSITNAAEQAEQTFRFDPNDWIRTLSRIQKNRQSLVGIYHSHPRTQPLPSLADLAGLQYVQEISYWIISYIDLEHPIVQAYWYNQESFTPLMFAQISI